MPETTRRGPQAWRFRPARVLFEPAALEYGLGRRLWERFSGGPGGDGGAGADRRGDGDGGWEEAPEVRLIPSHNRVYGLPGETPAEAYREAKRTLVVGVRRGLDFATCRPSAHYQLPLVTSCPGLCEYCYLQTTLGPRPYLRVYVNVEDILARAAELVASSPRAEGDSPVLFEGAAVGDPVPVEPLTGSLAAAVSFFARLPRGRFRFVTKFPNLDGLIGINHGGHTRVRVTVNPPDAVSRYDRATPDLETRLATLGRLSAAGYPAGVMIAPVFLEGPWRRDYEDLFRRLARARPSKGGEDLTLEVVTHRFTVSARRVILQRHAETSLPMDETRRLRKRGQFGYSKYVYPRDLMKEAEEFFRTMALHYLPGAVFDYFV